MLWGILIVYLESRDAGCCYGTTVQEYMPAVDYEVEQQDYRNSSSNNNNNNNNNKKTATTCPTKATNITTSTKSSSVSDDYVFCIN